ncbi:MAG: beta-N-acetylhexosaminidase [Sphingomonadaceae bacterium]|nr:beta-N-acetylhexosaminidase [Sphingomonadaceae bacterium]
MTPLLLGLSGLTLTEDERALFRAADPAGYILFGRNIGAPEQVRALTAELRALTGRDDLPILVDQEGGRVARLGPPHWPLFPPARRFGEVFAVAPVTAIEAARINARAIAVVLAGLGISVDCLPVLDVPVPGAHDIIGDRAYAPEPGTVASLGDATLRGLREGGVVGVVKHIPGHGRAAADSHLELPVVTADRAALEADFAPFRALAAAPMAMTAHVLYEALDPTACASQSRVVVEQTIRGAIGFDGLLMADDLGMSALGGTLPEKLAGVLAAGCDLALHCSGDFAENAALCEAAPSMTAEALERLARAMAWPRADGETDVAALVARRDALLVSAA